eukprot:NODE_32_length_37098_cov_1.132760.p30 type:complete len:107 gc:universal NODE_32_length_37098_cov_1.132760:28711-29031(+)
MSPCRRFRFSIANKLFSNRVMRFLNWKLLTLSEKITNIVWVYYIFLYKSSHGATRLAMHLPQKFNFFSNHVSQINSAFSFKPYFWFYKSHLLSASATHCASFFAVH